MSIILGNPMAFVGKKPVVPKFSYTGAYTEREDGVVELRSSGVLIFNEDIIIDRFMVGGGGSGGWSVSGSYPYLGGGGGGGYTRTDRNVKIAKDSPISVIIGAGGALKATTGGSANGQTTSWGDISVNGGEGGLYQTTTAAYRDGRPGGSGGGGSDSNSTGGQGGSDGSDGVGGYPQRDGGKGQGNTTREFGEPTGKLYAGGGGGARYANSSTPQQPAGGDGGGGDGAWVFGTNGVAAESGGDNTGGGGGGGGKAQSNSSIFTSGGGGSGIVCFRVAQELPELAGTWVLNERLYAPENSITENIRFSYATFENQTKFSDGSVIKLNDPTPYLAITGAGGYNFNLYNFNINGWQSLYGVWKFEAGTNASDKFRAWLASNATKQ